MFCKFPCPKKLEIKGVSLNLQEGLDTKGQSHRHCVTKHLKKFWTPKTSELSWSAIFEHCHTL